MMKSTDERYENDPAFHRLVAALYYEIMRSNYTPSEIREAAMYACIMHESRTVRNFRQVIPNDVESAMHVLSTWAKSDERHERR